MQTVHLSAENSHAIVKTKIELYSHADTCVVGDQCLVVQNYNRPMNIFRYDLKVGPHHDCIDNATVAYTEPEMGCVVILLVNQAVELKGLDHHLLCPMQCCMNGAVIDFLAPILSETPHSIQIKNPFDTTHPIIIPLKLN